MLLVPALPFMNWWAVPPPLSAPALLYLRLGAANAGRKHRGAAERLAGATSEWPARPYVPLEYLASLPISSIPPHPPPPLPLCRLDEAEEDESDEE